MNSKTIALATAAAALFLASTTMAAEGAADKAEVKCEGVNACKGTSACKTADHACKGKNACKAKGFLMLSDKECSDAKAAAEKH